MQQQSSLFKILEVDLGLFFLMHSFTLTSITFDVILGSGKTLLEDSKDLFYI
jgi:hypothetical protein